MQRHNASLINRFSSQVNTLKAMKRRIVLEHIAQSKKSQNNLLRIEVILTAHYAEFSSTHKTTKRLQKEKLCFVSYNMRTSPAYTRGHPLNFLNISQKFFCASCQFSAPSVKTFSSD